MLCCAPSVVWMIEALPLMGCESEQRCLECCAPCTAMARKPKVSTLCMQTIMGAVWMMGLFEGVKGVNKKVLVKVNMAWGSLSVQEHCALQEFGVCLQP